MTPLASIVIDGALIIFTAAGIVILIVFLCWLMTRKGE